MPIDQFIGLGRERVHLRTPDDKPKDLEQSSDLVLGIALHLDEESAAAQQSPNGMSIERLDADLFVPAALHDARDAGGIVAIAFVDLHLQRSLGVPCTNANDG